MYRYIRIHENVDPGKGGAICSPALHYKLNIVQYIGAICPTSMSYTLKCLM